MATGQTRFVGGIIPKKSAVAGKIPTGTTTGEIFSNLPDKKLWGFDGVNVFEYGSNSYFSLTGGTISGSTRIIGNLSADTLYSGSTNLYSIFQQIGAPVTQVAVQNGTNTYTGGTAALPTVNVSALTINTLVASGSSQLNSLTSTSISGGTISGGTIYSGSTNLSSIFQPTLSISNGLTLTGNALKLGGALTSTTNITGNQTLNLGTTTLRLAQFNTFASTKNEFFVGSSATTGSYSVLGLYNSTSNYLAILQSTDGVNITSLELTPPTIDFLIGASTVLRLSTGETIVNNGTNNSMVITDPNAKGAVYATDYTPNFTPESLITKRYVDNSITGITSGLTNTAVQPGTNTYTGGTSSLPTVNVSALTINTLVASGSSQLGTTTASLFSGGTVSGGTLFSGSTNLYLIFQPTGANTVLGAGTNTYTGGTFYNQTVNVSALTINTLVVSGSSQLGTTTATSISGGTISGGTIYSGSTNLSLIFHPLGSVSPITNGTNTYTGGTFLNPTVNVSALTISTLISSGSSQLGTTTASSFSGGTVSGGTLYSGSTNLNSIFAPIGSIAGVGAGSNITTGGTFFNPSINLVASPSINNLISSGSAQMNSETVVLLSGGTISGGTIISGSTNLNSIFAPIGSITGVGPGSNITTGGTFFNPTISLAASPSINNLISSGSSQLNTVTAVSVSAATLTASTSLTSPTIYGSAAASGTLLIDSTSNATKGAITFGAASGTNIYNFNVGSGTTLFTVREKIGTSQGALYLGVASGSETNANYALNYNGVMQLNSPTTTSSLALKVGDASAFSIQPGNSAAVAYFAFATRSRTTLTSGATIPVFDVTSNTQQWATGPVPNQFFYYLRGQIMGFVASSTVTSAYGLLTESTSAGTNCIITNNYAAGFNGNVSITGNTNVTGTLTASTLSANTIFSGSTNLSTLFLNTNGQTAVSPGSNITTGGTFNLPIVSLAASPSINGLTTSGASQLNSTLTVTGNTILQGLTASTISATTYLNITYDTMPDEVQLAVVNMFRTMYNF